MKILIVDRDESASQMIISRLTALGHQVVYDPAKNNALDRLSGEKFDVIIADPAPLTSLRPLILNIRRAVGRYPYIFLMSETASAEDAVKCGANDILSKPISADALERKMAGAEYLLGLIKRIGDSAQDFPSSGGVIAKSAFNQLFLSAIDRADRYGEATYILFISLANYEDIRNHDSAYAINHATAKLSHSLTLMRRQSDIIGQTARHEFALLLQRPVYDTEPVEAANRFAETLGSLKDLMPAGAGQAKISVTLVAVPTGQKLIEHIVTPAASPKS